MVSIPGSKAKSLPEAKVLYGRAIELDGSNAALRGNLSMVQLQMGEFAEALASAEAAVANDAEWAKGYYRKAMALDKLGQFAEATWALEEAIRRTEGEKQGC